MYLLGEWKHIDGYKEKQFIPWQGKYENCSEDEQEMKDLLVVLGNENLEIIKLGSPQRMEIDLTDVKDIRVLE